MDTSVTTAVYSVLDPHGLEAPLTIQGRALLSELTMDTHDWDAPLPGENITGWQLWRDSLQDLKQLHIPGPYTKTSLSESEHIELCVF